MREGFFFLVVAFLVLALQTTWMGFLMPVAYKPDVFLILVIWTSLRMPFMIGIGLAFAGGIFVDIFSGAPAGLFAIVYCLIFVMGCYLDGLFRIDTRLGRAMTVLMATLVSGAAVLLWSVVVGSAEYSGYVLSWALAKSVMTAMASLLVFPVLDRAWGVYTTLIGTR
ncbi:MAG: rod shape-determining protein MreD [Desulfomonile tiedjei]|nr:rod shape-determining protein MreD [Desulfomonile tiedjei]